MYLADPVTVSLAVIMRLQRIFSWPREIVSRLTPFKEVYKELFEGSDIWRRQKTRQESTG